MNRSCEYCIVQYLTEVEEILKFYFSHIMWWDSPLIRCCVCWNGAVCAQIHTCRRWRQHLHCERCSCGRVGQWPVKFRPSPRWSDERTMQSGARSNLLVTRVRLSISFNMLISYVILCLLSLSNTLHRANFMRSTSINWWDFNVWCYYCIIILKLYYSTTQKLMIK